MAAINWDQVKRESERTEMPKQSKSDHHVIAFQGERGAYGEEAVIRYFGPEVVALPCKSFADVFNAIIDHTADGGLVPIENSQAGSINEVYDLLHRTNASVRGELCLPVNHRLLCLPGQTLSDIHRVISHPQALAQCDAYLRHLGVEIVATYDTAGSAKMIREQELRGVAAVASARAGEIYGLETLAENIQTITGNYTRFVALAERPGEWPTGEAKTMLLMMTAHEPGALYRALGAFAERNINLLKLESRPSREKPWEYVFYLDIAGALSEPVVREALDALKEHTLILRVFGSFARDPGC